MNEKKFMVFIYIKNTCKINICIYFSNAQILKILLLFSFNIKKKNTVYCVFFHFVIHFNKILRK